MTACGRAVPVWRSEIYKRFRRVSSTRAWRVGGPDQKLGGTFCVDHQVGCCGLVGRGFDIRGFFFLDFRVSGFGTAARLGSGFLCLAFLVVVTLGCLSASVTA